MPRYNYICEDCEDKVVTKFGNKMTESQFEELVLFETSHSMEPSKKELLEAARCPRCQSTKCHITVFGTDICSYIKGYGWRDRDGARRDMHTYHLTNSDPYAQYRVPGEVDDMKKKLRKAGTKHSSTKHFVQDNKSMQKTVERVVKHKSE